MIDWDMALPEDVSCLAKAREGDIRRDGSVRRFQEGRTIEGSTPTAGIEVFDGKTVQKLLGTSGFCFAWLMEQEDGPFC